jgi:hypothetical protein
MHTDEGFFLAENVFCNRWRLLGLPLVSKNIRSSNNWWFTGTTN